MTHTPPPFGTASLDACSDTRRASARLERLKAQVTVVQDAVSVLSALLTEEIDDRQRAIAAQAAPLEAQVRVEYAALCARLESVRIAYDALATSLDDSVRRHAERDIDSAEFERAQRVSEEGLREHAAELAALDALRARFLAVLGDEPAMTLGTPRPLGELPALGLGVRLPTRALPKPAEAAPVVQPPPATVSSTVLLALPLVPAPVAVAVARAAATPVNAAEIAPILDVPSESQAVLVEAHQAGAGACHAVVDGLHIGRAAENDLRVLDPSVSRQHASLAVSSGEFVIEDLHSQNGTFVNGERIRQRVLCDGDRISIGEAEFVFRTSRSPGPAPEGGGDEVAADAGSSAS